MAAASWAPGDEADVLVDEGHWRPATIIGGNGQEGYRISLAVAGGLRPPRGVSAAPQEEAGVTPARLAPAGRHVPRWRLCGPQDMVEIKVRLGVFDVGAGGDGGGRGCRRRRLCVPLAWRRSAAPGTGRRWAWCCSVSCGLLGAFFGLVRPLPRRPVIGLCGRPVRTPSRLRSDAIARNSRFFFLTQTHTIRWAAAGGAAASSPATSGGGSKPSSTSSTPWHDASSSPT
jgi:hypothetical protein